MHDYGHGTLQYQFEKYTLRDQYDCSDKNMKVYIVAQEYLTKEEKDRLKPYCQCRYHNMYSFNPMKYLTCRCCVGCIDSPSPSVHVIAKTREYMKSKI